MYSGVSRMISKKRWLCVWVCVCVGGGGGSGVRWPQFDKITVLTLCIGQADLSKHSDYFENRCLVFIMTSFNEIFVPVCRPIQPKRKTKSIWKKKKKKKKKKKTGRSSNQISTLSMNLFSSKMNLTQTYCGINSKQQLVLVYNIMDQF